ncbi:inosine 5'-monophosphate dehydrogenase [Novipirellula aureliae]|uniref:Inosine 5'-monophosphate dehydrogenase n=1 Tax=Novipirellula aureliae TaxID=2527966 RepID=A0A5C6DT64_9BACT|nr:CBS domain-containing protein [Novipirellula aureliae]TWU39910.1 inosine 5'-monophosphate dehydrogenase [Novipirellula aureliae]
MNAEKQKLQTHVEEFMQRDPRKVMESDTVYDAIEILKQNQISAVPVVDKSDCLVGILSVSDLLGRLQTASQTLKVDFPMYEDCFWVSEMIQHTFGTDKVATAMTPVPATAAPNDTLQQVAKLMLENHVHHVPIVGEQMSLLGIVSSFDVVRLAADGGLS